MTKNAMSKAQVLQSLQAFQTHDLNTKGGNVWAYVYDSGLQEVEEVAMDAYKMFANHNGVDFTVFPSLLQLENEIVGEMASLFSNQPETLAGTFTSGGTESIILAVKAARDYAKHQKPHIKHPEMVMPETAHASFHKAAYYLGIKVVKVPVDDDFKANPKLMAQSITENTVMMIASSVSYAQGVVDPIETLGKLAKEKNLWFHVDACIGGFVLAYAKKLGFKTPQFDFSIPGVKSLTVDLHKYAFAPKGASVILYRDKQLRKFQFSTATDWPGYPVINTTVQSTKSGGPLAACWATLRYIGEDGYKKLIGKIMQTKESMLKHFAQLKDVYVMGEPDASLIAFSSDTIDLFQLADEMRKNGWFIQVQPGNENFAASIHLTITPVSEQIEEKFFEQLQAAIEKVKASPRQSVKSQIEAVMNEVMQEGNGLDPDKLRALLQIAGVKENGMLPDEMATINELLRLLPPEITSEAFLHITNELFTPEI